MLFSTAAAQANVVIERLMASHLPEGSIAALNYALKLTMMPHGLLLLSAITGLVSDLSFFGSGEPSIGI